MKLPVIFVLPFIAWAQDPQFDPQDRVEQAHRPMLESKTKASKRASDVTAEFAKTRAALKAQKPVARRNYIDQHVFGRMERDRVPHAPLVSDEEFARRAWLDSIGRIPQPEELLAFAKDSDASKRDKLIDRLTSSDAFVDRWTYYFEDLFRAGGRMGSGLNLFHYWVKEFVRLDRPYNEVVRDLLTQSSKISHSAPGGMYFARDFVKAKDDPETPDAEDMINRVDTIDEFTVTYGKVFLGLNLACISCHDGKNHLEKVNLYLTSKKRADFFAQAAFFGNARQIMNREGGAQLTTEYTVDDTAKGYELEQESIVRVPRVHGAKPVVPPQPRFLLTGEQAKSGENSRDELARLMTTNIQFRRAFANRLWAELMGFGVVEPVDEFDLDRYRPKGKLPAGFTQQPSNPDLLDAMAADFQKNNHSLRHMVRTIMKSSAYQLSSTFPFEWKPEYANYYARKFVRSLTAPELHDAINSATGRQGSFKLGSEKVPMAMQMPEPNSANGETKQFLKTFGMSNRDDMPKKVSATSLQAMMLMQSRLVTEGVAAKGARVEQLLKDVADDDQLVERLYLATVSRHPSPAELVIAKRELAKNRLKGAQNLQWALINSPEFLFNY